MSALSRRVVNFEPVLASYCRQRWCVRTLNMRTEYVPPPMDKLNYFPGHMHAGVFQINAKIRNVDVLIEVHDARVPISGRNPRFSRSVISSRCHVLVMNKADLIPAEYRENIQRRLSAGGDLNVVFTNCHDHCDRGLRSLIATAVNALHARGRNESSVGRHGGRFARELGEYHCMVVGVPNVGKSSLINALRALHLSKSRATPVGARPGVTTSVLNRIRVSSRPHVYVFDTPGVLMPRVSDPEQVLRLALCAALQDHLVGPEYLADYLLYWLNRRGRYEYVQLMGVDGPLDDINVLLRDSAISHGLFIKRKDLTRSGSVAQYPDVYQAAMNMIRAFRAGSLGKILLDDEILDQERVSDHGCGL